LTPAIQTVLSSWLDDGKENAGETLDCEHPVFCRMRDFAITVSFYLVKANMLAIPNISVQEYAVQDQTYFLFSDHTGFFARSLWCAENWHFTYWRPLSWHDWREVTNIHAPNDIAAFERDLMFLHLAS
jgi:hypothetical protein